jgi:hypothetical protein
MQLQSGLAPDSLTPFFLADSTVLENSNPSGS